MHKSSFCSTVLLTLGVVMFQIMAILILQLYCDSVSFSLAELYYLTCAVTSWGSHSGTHPGGPLWTPDWVQWAESPCLHFVHRCPSGSLVWRHVLANLEAFGNYQKAFTDPLRIWGMSLRTGVWRGQTLSMKVWVGVPQNIAAHPRVQERQHSWCAQD